MKKLDLSSLQSITLETVVTPTAKPRTAAVGLPTGMNIRLTSSGRIFPSEDLVGKFDLQYMPKNEEVDTITGNVTETVVGYGVDIIPSAKWSMVKGLEELVLFIGFVPRTEPKIDMWGSCKYDKESGDPKSDIFTQGANTYAKETLVNTVAQYFDIDWATTSYVDLEVVISSPIASSNGVYIVPKTVTRGDHKGEDSYERRENIEIYPMQITHVEEREAVVAEEATTEAVIPEVIEDHNTQEAPGEVFESKAVETKIAEEGEFRTLM